MTFVGIYFKHKSTEYAKMPYTADSGFKYIALHLKDINDYVIWRDSLEPEKLTQQRIKRLKAELTKYKVRGINIKSMDKAQKISRTTINASADSAQIKYLLSLNSVFEIAKTRVPDKPSGSGHGLWLLGTCWKHVVFYPWLNKGGREHCRMDRRRAQKEKKNRQK